MSIDQALNTAEAEGYEIFAILSIGFGADISIVQKAMLLNKKPDPVPFFTIIARRPAGSADEPSDT